MAEEFFKFPPLRKRSADHTFRVRKASFNGVVPLHHPDERVPHQEGSQSRKRRSQRRMSSGVKPSQGICAE